MYCPSCGKSIADGSAFCMHCGRATGLAVAGSQVQPAPYLASSPNAPICPECGQMDAAQKVSALVAGGKSTGYIPNPQGLGYRETYSSTELAQKLAAAAPTGARLHALAEQQMPPFPGKVTKDRTQFEQMWPVWKAQLDRKKSEYYLCWQETCYCSRCHSLFRPGEGRFGRLDSVEDFIANSPIDKTIMEVCEIEHAYLGQMGGGSFRFLAPTPESGGSQFFKVHIWKESVFRSHKGIDTPSVAGPNSNCSVCKQALEQIIRDVADEGWVKLDTRGYFWWQVRFRRNP